MDMKQLMEWLLGLKIIAGLGTYVTAGIMILGGVVGAALGLVDAVTASGWIAGGYGLIRSRIATARLEKQIGAKP